MTELGYFSLSKNLIPGMLKQKLQGSLLPLYLSRVGRLSSSMACNKNGILFHNTLSYIVIHTPKGIVVLRSKSVLEP